MSFLGHMHLCQQLDVPHVTALLVTGQVDSFFRGVCHVSHFGWFVLFQMLKSATYTQQNSSPTFYISKISSFDIPRLSTLSRSVSSHPQFSSVQSQVYSSSSVLGFPSNFKISEIVVSSSSNSVDKAIDEYHDSNYSVSSSNSSSSSSGGNTTDKEYTSSVPRVPLEILQELLRTRATFGVGTSTNILVSFDSLFSFFQALQIIQA